MAGGRETKYKPEYVDTALDYAVNYSEHDHAIPSIAGLAVVIGVCKNTIYNWSKEDGHEEFLRALGQVSTNQELKALNNGITGVFNPAITKLVLHNHGYGEDVNNTNEDTDLAETLAALAEKLPD